MYEVNSTLVCFGSPFIGSVCDKEAGATIFHQFMFAFHVMQHPGLLESQKLSKGRCKQEIGRSSLVFVKKLAMMIRASVTNSTAVDYLHIVKQPWLPDLL